MARASRSALPLTRGPGGPDGGSRQVDFGRIRESGRLNGGIEIIGPPPFPED